MSRVGLILFVVLLGGCAWFEAMTSRQAVDTRIVLDARQHMEFGRVSRRNEQGQHMDEYRCPTDMVMVCESHGVNFDCSCWRSGL